jgi:hypothetical protein
MDFWDIFWLLIIFIPLLMIWGFALVDIFRRDDMPGWLKALWVIVVILAPFFGTLIYLIFRRPGATPAERDMMDKANKEFVEKYAPSDHAQQLAVLADLHDRGKLTDAEFAAEKARLVQESAPAATTAPAVTTTAIKAPTTANAAAAPTGGTTPGPTGI